MKQLLLLATIFLIWVMVSCTAVPDADLATAAPTRTPAPSIETTAILTAASPSSPSSILSQSDGESYHPVISNDGHIVAFISKGLLTTNSQPGRLSAYVRDLETHTTHLVSVRSDGQPAYGYIFAAAMSGDGRVIAYHSFDGTLTTDDPDPCGPELTQDGCEDLFIYDRESEAIERIDQDRVVGVGGDYTVGLSFDGRFVAYDEVGKLNVYDRQTSQIHSLLTATNQQPTSSSFGYQFTQLGDFVFVSYADNLVPNDTNDTADVFIWLIETGEVKRLSVASNGTEANDVSGDILFIDDGDLPAIAVSDDGRYVAFTSIATNLTTEDINLCEDWTYSAEHMRPCQNLYMHDRETGETRLITHNSNGDSRSPALSGDGRYLVFVSSAQNLVDDGGSCPDGSLFKCLQIYLYDSQTEEIKLISRGMNGLPGNSGNIEADISVDGQIITFTSDASNLILGDTNGQSDIFIYDQETGQIERISVPNE